MRTSICDSNVYVTQTCASFYCTIDKCTGCGLAVCYGSTPKDELRDPRGPLANNIPSCVIEQVDQEVQQDNHHSQHASNQASIAL